MRYLPKSHEERGQMLRPRSAPGLSTISSPSSQPSTGSTAISMCRASRRRARSSTTSSAAGAEERHRLRQLPGRGRYRHYRPVIIDALVQRGEFLTSYTPYQAEDHAGHAAGDLRIPDHDCRTHRHGRGQRQHVRRFNRRGRSGDDGRARDRPPQGRRRLHGASRISRSAATYCNHQGLADVSDRLRSPKPAASILTRWRPPSPKKPQQFSSRARTSSASLKTFLRSPRSRTQKARC